MWWNFILPTGAALIAGAMNAVAGGGSFFTFPALVFVGVPPINANASSTVALFPGAFASAWAYRDDFRNFRGVPFRALLAVSILGGMSGALLLLYTSQEAFDFIIPWLLLLATLAFIFGPWISKRFQTQSRVRPGWVIGLQFLIALYGGYFGGAVGLIMLASWSLLGLGSIRVMNATKTLLGGSMNAAAVVLFVLAGKIWWPQTLAMLAAAVVGGYVGARYARWVNPEYLRVGITIISIAVTIAFFVRQ